MVPGLPGLPAQDPVLCGHQQDSAECLSQTESDWWFFSEAARPRQEVETPLSSEVQWRPHRGNTGLIVPTPSSHLSTSLPPTPPLTPPSALIVSREMLFCSGQHQHHNQTTETLKKSQSASSGFVWALKELKPTFQSVWSQKQSVASSDQ